MPREFLTSRPAIIAELGENVFPYSRDRLLRLIDVAQRAGADGVKVQLYRAEHFPPEEQAKKTETVFPREEFPAFVNMVANRGMAAGASVFDTDAVDLCKTSGASFVKLASREEDNDALRIYCSDNFSGPIFRSFDRSPTNQDKPLHNREIPFGTVAAIYPADQLASIFRILDVFDWANPNRNKSWPFGWSSNTAAYTDCITAAVNGASYIEKHLKLNGTDREAGWSLDESGFKSMMAAIGIGTALRST